MLEIHPASRNLNQVAREVYVESPWPTEDKTSGFKIRLKDGLEAITTATHRYVWNPASPLPLRLLPKSHSALCAHITVAPGSSMTGIVTGTYDEPSPSAYPHGYTHDMSLITGTHLPATTSTSPAILRISGWAPYEDALDGHPAYAVLLNGTVAADIKRAIVAGSACFWDSKSAG